MIMYYSLCSFVLGLCMGYLIWQENLKVVKEENHLLKAENRMMRMKLRRYENVTI